MIDKRTYVYIVKNDYMPEPGSWIEGIYSTEEKAKARVKELQSGESEYSFSEDDCENFEIEREVLL
jgi:hypothetical protein